MFIQTEETPNPNTLKFIPGVQVLKEGTVEFKDNVSAMSSNLAKLLFSVNEYKIIFTKYLKNLKNLASLITISINCFI